MDSPQIEAVKRALEIITSCCGDMHRAGAKSETEIDSAEEALDVLFPPSYRSFLRRVGACSFNGHEIFGLTTSDYEDAGIPNVVWLTSRERKAFSLPRELVVVEATGDGDYYTIDCSQSDGSLETPIVMWSPVDTNATVSSPTVAMSFGEFLLERARECVEGPDNDQE